MAYQRLITAAINDIRITQPGFDPATLTGVLVRLKRELDDHYKRPYIHYAYARDCFRSAFGADSTTTLAASAVFRMSRTQFKRVKDADAMRTIERNQHQTVLTYEFIRERFSWLQANGQLIDDISIVMLCTGCRRVELVAPITEDGQFVEFEALGKTHIIQHGLAKKTDKTLRTFVTKPCLFLGADEIIAMINKIRYAIRETMDTGRDNGVFAKRMECLAKTAFPQFTLASFPVGSHIYRAIYADIAYRLHGAASESQVAFVADVLGHERFMAVPNYLHVRVVFEGDSPHFFEEALRQQGSCADPLSVVYVDLADGSSVKVLSAPHRRLNPVEREQLKQNRINDLALKGVVVTRRIMRQLSVD